MSRTGPPRKGLVWAGDGLSLSVVRLPNGTRLYLADKHLHARYWLEMYRATQLAQAG